MVPGVIWGPFWSFLVRLGPAAGGPGAPIPSVCYGSVELPEAPCADDDSAVAALGGCAGATATLGCTFDWGGVPRSEVCPESCGECGASCVADGSDDSDCDGVDDDCDGEVDDGYASMATSCGVGACASTGATSRVDGALVNSCEPGSASADDASCDGVDSDCDGVVDEDDCVITNGSFDLRLGFVYRGLRL